MINILEKCKVDKNEILSMCKKEKSTNIKDLGRDMYKDNEVILNKYFRNENGYPCYYANLLYFRKLDKDIPNEVKLKIIKAELRKDFGETISLAGYKYNAEHYRFVKQFVQDEYEEDLFKNKSNEDEENELEADRHKCVESIDNLDIINIDRLYNEYFTALKHRLLVIFDLVDAPAILNNCIECYYLGVSLGPTKQVIANKLANIDKIINDKEFIQWMKSKPTDLAVCDEKDYIETYQKSLRQLTKITDMSFDEIKDLIHNEEDIFEEDILRNEMLEVSYIDYSFDSDEDE